MGSVIMYGFLLSVRVRKRRIWRMIVNTTLIIRSNVEEFRKELYAAVERLQHEDNLKVEIQYQLVNTEEHSIVYSALLIGRKKPSWCE
jgi:hypothetical protein